MKSKSLNILLQIVTFILIAYLVFTRLGFIFGIISIVLMIIYYIFSNKYIFYIFKAQNAIRAGNNKDALLFFEKAYNCNGCPNETKISYTFLLLKNGHVEEAYNILKYLKTNTFEKSQRARVDMNLSIAHYLKGDLEKAILILEDLKEDHVNSTLYGNLGAYYIEEGDLQKALKLCEEAYEYNNKDIGILDNLATVHMKLKNYKFSEKFYDELMELNPKDPDSYYNFGKLEKELGNYERAAELFKASLNKESSFFSKFNKEEAIKELEEIDKI